MTTFLAREYQDDRWWAREIHAIDWEAARSLCAALAWQLDGEAYEAADD